MANSLLSSFGPAVQKLKQSIQSQPAAPTPVSHSTSVISNIIPNLNGAKAPDGTPIFANLGGGTTAAPTVFPVSAGPVPHTSASPTSTPASTNQATPTGDDAVKSLNSDISSGKDFGLQMLPDGSLGRVDDKRSQEVSDLLAKQNALSQGYDSAAMRAAQESSDSQLNRALQMNQMALRSSQGANGVNGGAAQAGELALLRDNNQQRQDYQTQNLLNNYNAKLQGTQAYGSALNTARGDELNRTQYNQGNQGKEKAGQVSAALGYAGLAQGARSGALQNALDNRALDVSTDALNFNKGQVTGANGGAAPPGGSTSPPGGSTSPASAVVPNPNGTAAQKAADLNTNLLNTIVKAPKDSPAYNDALNKLSTNITAQVKADHPTWNDAQVKAEASTRQKNLISSSPNANNKNLQPHQTSISYLCTELHRQGLLATSVFDASHSPKVLDAAYWSGPIPLGYAIWGVPLARKMRTSLTLTAFLAPLIILLTHHVAYLAGEYPVDTFAGKAIYHVWRGVSAVVGTVAKKHRKISRAVHA